MTVHIERDGVTGRGECTPYPRYNETLQSSTDEIRSVEYRRYTVAYCPTCQTDGKILADNTTSKFLK